MMIFILTSRMYQLQLTDTAIVKYHLCLGASVLQEWVKPFVVVWSCEIRPESPNPKSKLEHYVPVLFVTWK